MYFWLLIFGFAGILGLLIFLIISTKRFAKDRSSNFPLKKFLQLYGTCFAIGLFLISFLFGMILYDSNPALESSYYSPTWHVTPKEYFYLIFFGLLMGTCGSSIYVSYYLSTRKTTFARRTIRRLNASVLILIFVTFISFLFVLQGLANNLYYPLVNGIYFSSAGVKLIRSNDYISGGFAIKFYGIFIVLGFFIAYGISERYFFKRYGQHGLMDMMLIVVFIFGLLGARFWFCYVLELSKGNVYSFIDFLKVWEGGLAIEGGVIFGTIFGSLYFILFNKKVNVRNVLDYVAPCILIGQISGRIGNFLNHEVYGAVVERATFGFFPDLVLNQMSVSWTDVGGKIYVPLFLIEMLVNFAGYLIIRFVIGEGFKKFRSLGDLCGAYISWYGLVRVIMEPLRDGQFLYESSWVTSWCMVGGGIAFIIILHLYDFLKYGKDDLIIFLISKIFKKPVYLKKNVGPYIDKDAAFLHNGRKPEK